MVVKENFGIIFVIVIVRLNFDKFVEALLFSIRITFSHIFPFLYSYKYFYKKSSVSFDDRVLSFNCVSHFGQTCVALIFSNVPRMPNADRR